MAGGWSYCFGSFCFVVGVANELFDHEFGLSSIVLCCKKKVSNIADDGRNEILKSFLIRNSYKVPM